MDFRLIRHLYYFSVVADEAHFGNAARRLGLTQPPLSAQIKTLENSLGVKLLERSRSGVRLTPHGETILPAVRRLVENSKKLESQIYLSKAGQINSLSVGAVTSAMFHPLGIGIKRAKERIPGLVVLLTEMDTVDSLLALEAEDIDLAIVRAPVVSKPLICKPMISEKLAVAMSPDHALGSHEKIPMEALSDEPLVMCPRQVSPTYFDTIHHHFMKAEISLRVPHTAESILSQIAMASCGVGVAIIPRSFIGYESDKVVYRWLDSDAEVVTTAVVWNGRRQSEVLEDFISILFES